MIELDIFFGTKFKKNDKKMTKSNQKKNLPFSKKKKISSNVENKLWLGGPTTIFCDHHSLVYLESVANVSFYEMGNECFEVKPQLCFSLLVWLLKLNGI